MSAHATNCPHTSWSGDEGPAILLGRPVRRWKCDGCGQIKTDAPTHAAAVPILDRYGVVKGWVIKK